MQPIDLYVDIPRNETVLKTFYFTSQTDPSPTTLPGLNPNFLIVKLSLNSGYLSEPEKNMLLFKALSFKDRPMLDYLTKIKPNVNQSLSRESNLITRACSIPLPDVVRTLTEKFQADLNLPEHNALIATIRSYNMFKNYHFSPSVYLRIISYLLSKGADPHLKCELNGRTPFDWALLSPEALSIISHSDKTPLYYFTLHLCHRCQYMEIPFCPDHELLLSNKISGDRYCCPQCQFSNYTLLENNTLCKKCKLPVQLDSFKVCQQFE